MSPNPERPYALHLPRFVEAALDVLFDESLQYRTDDHFGPSLDLIYYTLRVEPHRGEVVVGEVEWQGKRYESRVFKTPFLRATYVIDEEAHRVVIYVPIELMPGRSYDE